MKIMKLIMVSAAALIAATLITPAFAIESGTYQIIAKHSQKCLDVSGVSKSNGAKVHQWGCHDGDNQKWQIKETQGGVEIKALHSGKCLDVEGVSYNNGAMMQQWSCSGGANQRFSFTSQGNDYYQIQPVHSGKVIEVGASKTTNGANVKQWSWWGSDSQQFKLKKVSNSSTPATTAVWSENFNNHSAGSQWMGSHYTQISNNCGTDNSKCVRVTYYPSSEGSPRTVQNIKLPAAKEYTLNYDVMFENGYEFVRGGKLPGLGPDNDTAGCSPIASNGWSARVMWRAQGAAEIYSYHQNRQNRCGDDFYSPIQFAVGKYQAISLHVKVNDPWLANGLIELYVDGKKVATHQNAQLRGTSGDNTLITRMLFHTFFGGSSWDWAPSKTVYSRFDNFSVYPGLRVRSQPGQ